MAMFSTDNCFLDMMYQVQDVYLCMLGHMPTVPLEIHTTYDNIHNTIHETYDNAHTMYIHAYYVNLNHGSFVLWKMLTEPLFSINAL
jgi:hypothetical protein